MQLQHISRVLGSCAAELFYRNLTDPRISGLKDAQQTTTDDLLRLGGGFFSPVTEGPTHIVPSMAPTGVLTPCSVSQGAVKGSVVPSCSWKFPANVRVSSEPKVQPLIGARADDETGQFPLETNDVGNSCLITTFYTIDSIF